MKPKPFFTIFHGGKFFILFKSKVAWIEGAQECTRIMMNRGEHYIVNGNIGYWKQKIIPIANEFKDFIGIYSCLLFKIILKPVQHEYNDTHALIDVHKKDTKPRCVFRTGNLYLWVYLNSTTLRFTVPFSVTISTL